MTRNNLYKILSPIIIISFIMNLIWENAQAPLYENYSGFFQHFSICLKGTLGDVVIIFIIYGIVSFSMNDWYWPRKFGRREILLILILGILIAIIIEERALQYGLWAYTSQMPLLPFLGIGLLPVLQMVILPITTFWLSGLMYNKLTI